MDPGNWRNWIYIMYVCIYVFMILCLFFLGFCIKMKLGENSASIVHFLQALHLLLRLKTEIKPFNGWIGPGLPHPLLRMTRATRKKQTGSGQPHPLAIPQKKQNLRYMNRKEFTLACTSCQQFTSSSVKCERPSRRGHVEGMTALSLDMLTLVVEAFGICSACHDKIDFAVTSVT